MKNINLKLVKSFETEIDAIIFKIDKSIENLNLT